MTTIKAWHPFPFEPEQSAVGRQQRAGFLILRLFVVGDTGHDSVLVSEVERKDARYMDSIGKVLCFSP